MKKITSIFLSLTIAVTTFIFPSTAETLNSEIWDGSVDTSWYTGNEESYYISTPSQLAGLSALVNSGHSMEGILINLTSDIVLNDTENWTDWYNNPPKNKFTPIGKSGNPVGGYYPFAGAFNGNGYTISGLYVKNETVAGLFGYLYCSGVGNIIMEKSVVIGYDDCETGKGVCTGGIAGIVEGSVINKCENRGYVYSIGDIRTYPGMRENYAGLIAGSLHTENMTATLLGTILAAGGVFVNPLIFTDGTSLIKSSGVYNCICSGKVHTQSKYESCNGGIVGWGNNGIVKNCLSMNGYNINGNTNLGMICGGAYNCSIENCYFWGGNDGTRNGLGLDWSTGVVSVERDLQRCTEEYILSEEFVEKIGSGYVYVKGYAPRLVCDKHIPVPKNNEISDFVDRLYKIILGRDAEAEGLADWTNRLKTGTASSAEIVYGIANSQEFANRGLSNEEIVETMYQAMLGRASDEGGKRYWVERLNAGMTVNAIINGFSGSTEFGNICANYGIQAGSVILSEARDKNFGLTSFVSRMYTKALGRDYDVAGLNDWTNRYLTGTAKVSDIAFGFIFSPEFVSKNLSNSDYVDTLYRTFFNREPDEGGKADWMNKLANGMAREDVLNGFVGSQECINLVATFGI